MKLVCTSLAGLNLVSLAGLSAFAPPRYPVRSSLLHVSIDFDWEHFTTGNHKRSGITGRSTIGEFPTPPVVIEKRPSSVENRSKTGRKWKQFLKSGAKDAYRMAHSSLGLASILVGLHHMIDILIIHSFSEVFKVPTILWTGVLHVLVGLLGIRRLNFKNEGEAARNAMFWPAPIQNMWLTFASLTEWGQGSGALFSMYRGPFATFTYFNIILTFWQLFEVAKKTGKNSKTRDSIWFKDSKKNALLVEFAYLFWMQIQMGTLLYIGCFVRPQIFLNFMNTFPKMQYLLSNLAINTAFFNNLAIFLATLLRYKLVSKPTHNNKVVFSLPLLSSVYIVWKVFSCFFFSYDGNMSSSFLSMILLKNS